MRKISFILPIAAVAMAVVGAYAAESKAILRSPINVSANNTALCNVDGKCDQIGSNACGIASTGLLFHIVLAPTSCSTVATGTFFQ